jgi:hypothetical protein
MSYWDPKRISRNQIEVSKFDLQIAGSGFVQLDQSDRIILSQIGAGDLHLGSEGLQVSGLQVYGSRAFEFAS